MGAVEKHFDGLSYELFTGHLSEKNLAFYEKLDYDRFKTEKVHFVRDEVKHSFDVNTSKIKV